MPQEIGESREKWGWDVWHMVEEFANKMSSESRPFYVVYACKEDRGLSNKTGTPVFKQALKAYYKKPPAILGILVWYVNHKTSEFRFVPELSAPHDIPIDEKLLSKDSKDIAPSLASKGKKLNVLVS